MIVDTDSTQTLENKTLGSLMFWDTDDSNFATIALPNLSADRIYSINQPFSDTFVFESESQTLTNKILTTPTIASFENAVHTHIGSGSEGGYLSASAINTGIFTVSRGGTGLSSLTAHGVLLGHGNSNISSLFEINPSRLLISQASADPEWKAVSGDVTMNNTGVMTVANDSHSHTIAHYTKTEIDALNGIGSANAFWIKLPLLGTDNTGANDWNFNFALENNAVLESISGTETPMMFEIAGIPYSKYGKNLQISDTEVTLTKADGSNYIDSVVLVAYSDETTPTQITLMTDNFNTADVHSEQHTTESLTGIIHAYIKLNSVMSSADVLYVLGVRCKVYYN